MELVKITEPSRFIIIYSNFSVWITSVRCTVLETNSDSHHCSAQELTRCSRQVLLWAGNMKKFFIQPYPYEYRMNKWNGPKEQKHAVPLSENRQARRELYIFAVRDMEYVYKCRTVGIPCMSMAATASFVCVFFFCLDLPVHAIIHLFLIILCIKTCCRRYFCFRQFWVHIVVILDFPFNTRSQSIVFSSINK